MEAIISYLVKAIISSGILTGYYWLVLRNKKLHQYNRYYLLLTIACSLYLPLLHFRWFTVNHTSYSPVAGLMTVVNPAPDDGLPAPSFDGWWVFLAGASLISLVLLGSLILKTTGIYRLKKKYQAVRMDGFYFIETDLPQAPFSFMNLLFWRRGISVKEPDGEKILQHEWTHIREKHTYDKLFSQLVVCIFWINPFYWLIQKELNMVHEFIADENTIDKGDSAAFARLLLRGHNGGSYLNPSHTFFHSPIKRRLTMITNNRSTTFSWWRRLLALPMVMLVAALFSFSLVNAQADSAKIAAEREAKWKKEYDERAAYEKLTPEQKEAREKKRRAELMERAQKIISNPPDVLYLLNGSVSTPEAIKGLDPANIKEMNSKTNREKQSYENFLNSAEGREMLQKYGDQVKKGIIEIRTN
jgi:hypothetical protein